MPILSAEEAAKRPPPDPQTIALYRYRSPDERYRDCLDGYAKLEAKDPSGLPNEWFLDQCKEDVGLHWHYRTDYDQPMKWAHRHEVELALVLPALLLLWLAWLGRDAWTPALKRAVALTDRMLYAVTGYSAKKVKQRWRDSGEP